MVTIGLTELFDLTANSIFLLVHLLIHLKSDWLPFIDVLVSNGFQCEADNGDGQINFFDIAGIQQRLLDEQSAAFTDTSTEGDGPGDFFWSTSNLNEGAVNGPLDLSLDPGESATLYLYYSTNGPSNSEIKIGYSVNVATSQSGVIEFTEADTFNPLGDSVGDQTLGFPGNRLLWTRSTSSRSRSGPVCGKRSDRWFNSNWGDNEPRHHRRILNA